MNRVIPIYGNHITHKGYAMDDYDYNTFECQDTSISVSDLISSDRVTLKDLDVESYEVIPRSFLDNLPEHDNEGKFRFSENSENCRSAAYWKRGNNDGQILLQNLPRIFSRVTQLPHIRNEIHFR
jgi:hypothetical protein